MTTSDIEHPGWRWRLKPWSWPWRKPASPESLLPALEPYHSLKRHRLRNFFGISLFMLFLLIYGFFFSVFVPTYFVFFMIPLLALSLLVIWVLPDLNWAPTRSLEWFFFATFIGLIVWPNYIAIAIPGLPWITVQRLTSFPAVFLFLISLSMSSDFRKKLAFSLNAIPSIPILLGIFAFIQLYSIGLSHELASSTQKFIVAQISWTGMFFIGVYVFRRPGQIKRWSFIMCGMAVFVSALAMLEHHVGHVLWNGYIPDFLKINDESVERILAGSFRSYTGRYRAQATFSTSLGLAEYLALTLPFILHFTTSRFSRSIRIVAAGSIPLLLYADYLTDAKLGMVGALFGVLLYIFVVAFQRRKNNKNSLLSASILFAYPVGLIALLAAIALIHRLRIIVLGDASHANSTSARIEQYALGFQKFLEWPFGYGVGQGAVTLGFGAEFGMLSIDTYYLSILLEYGFAGFVVYFGMFAIAIFEGTRRCLLAPAQNEDRSFLVPISASLTTFLVIKSVFSQQDNHPVVFMMLGALVAIVASHKKPAAVTKVKRTQARPKQLVAVA